MSEIESRSLRRATALLVLLSAARWVASQPTTAPGIPATDSAASLAREARAAADEEAVRNRPLAEGETVDPNRASEVQLDRLPGVGPATARAIVEARDSGVRFGRAEDLAAVRGIGPVLVERLRPSLDLRAPPGRPARSARSDGTEALDVNRADSSELVRLRGIGPVMAARIVAERRRRPFANLDDLTRVRGIGPATVARLRGVATVGSPRR
jgi:competence ComEA-like helix-hairpin-helix protein